MTTINIGTNTGDTSAGWLDTEIYKNTPTANGSTASPFTLRNDGGTNVNRAFFQLPNIAFVLGAGSTINSATIYIRRLNAGGSGNANVYRLKKTPTFNQTTWNKQNTATNWDTAGALGAADYDSTVLATAAISGTGYKSITGAGLVALIQGWVNGSIANNGFILDGDTGFATTADFGSAERNDGQRPYIAIDYTPAIPPS